MLNLKRYRIPVLLLVLAILLAALSCTVYAESNDPWSEIDNIARPAITLGYDIPLEVPSEYADTFVHAQKVHFTPVTEVFSMRIAGKEIPLYRIDFGNGSIGEWLGVLRTETGDIPVTYTFYPFSDEELKALDEETLNTYYTTMENFNVVTKAIYEDPRFIDELPEGLGENRELVLEHWTLSLPTNIVCVETNDGGVYSAAFYGRICGENIALYTVRIGGETDSMGVYVLDGQDKPLAIEIYEINRNVFWSEKDYETAYKMLETINDVMDTILSSENFKG